MRRLVGETLLTKAAVAALLITSGCAEDPELLEIPPCIQLGSGSTSDGYFFVNLAINTAGTDLQHSKDAGPGYIFPETITHYVDGTSVATTAGSLAVFEVPYDSSRTNVLIATGGGMACQQFLH